MRTPLFALLVLAACDPDADGDGYPASEDCDEEYADVNPGMPEICDEVDNNCDSIVDFAECATTYGPAFEVTIISAASPFTWDPNALSTGARPPDLVVSYGTYEGETDKAYCSTTEASDAYSAEWNTSCTMSFAYWDTFFVSLRDIDVFGSETIARWEWTHNGLVDLVGMGSEPMTLGAANGNVVLSIQALE
jgi:hypothetical protein